MEVDQRKAVLDLSLQRIGKEDFLQVYGIKEAEVPGEVSCALKQAMVNHDGEGVECALCLGFSFSFPPNILEFVHEMLHETWHSRHEDMIGILQDRADPSSIPVLEQAVLFKSQLRYLDYDDYGAYYKKCLWALQAIGSPDALEAIKVCAESGDPALKEQAEYRLSKIQC